MTTQTVRLRDHYSFVAVNCIIAVQIKKTNSIWNITCHERKIRKYRLAAILYEIGDEKDRSDVRDDVLLSDYAYLNNKLGIVEKTLKEIKERKNFSK